MTVPARLKWVKEKDRFAAYPTATDRQERFAAVWLLHDSYYGWQTWHWVAEWSGWFSEAGTATSKQEAADLATEAWWRSVQTEIPRNLDLEAAMIVARASVSPVPNSVFAEDPEFLRTILWHLHSVYKDEIAGRVQPVRNLYDQISNELFRRRETGEIPDLPKSEAISSGYKRRRRR